MTLIGNNFINEPKRITIVVGHYGSGKTEIAVNYALKLRGSGKKVVIVDFDIVNPYFRTKDAEELLTRHGIRVIAPGYANMNIENPSLPAEIYSVFEDPESYVIFDVGGDDDGAIPLGRYHRYFDREAYSMLFVLNERRMLTADVEGAAEIFESIQDASRLHITGIINNTHLKEFTTSETILQGQKLAEAFSQEVRIPVVGICGTVDCLDGLPSQYEPLKFPIHCFIQLKF